MLYDSGSIFQIIVWLSNNVPAEIVRRPPGDPPLGSGRFPPGQHRLATRYTI